MSEFYLPVPYQLTMLANTWTKQQTFTDPVSMRGGAYINSNGQTSGFGINNPLRPVILSLGAVSSSIGFDFYGNLEPINPGSFPSDGNWSIFNSNGEPAFNIVIGGASNPWTLRSPGKVNGLEIGTTPASSTPTIVSGTVYQNTSSGYQTIDIPCYATTAGTAGTVGVAYGTSSTPSTIYTQYVSGSTSSTAQAVIHLRVPPQWYYEVTASGVTLGTPTMVQE